MTVKSGDKCTAITRPCVAAALYDALVEALPARLPTTTLGNLRNDTVRMGALVSRAQLQSVREGLAQLRQEAQVLHDGDRHALVDADPAVAGCVGPTLLGGRDGDAAGTVHEMEVFGPVATLLP